MIRVQFRPVPGRVPPFHSVWLVLDEPNPPALVGFVRRDQVSGRWVARPRSGGNGIDMQCGFSDRGGAAEWLLVTMGGFTKPMSVAA